MSGLLRICGPNKFEASNLGHHLPAWRMCNVPSQAKQVLKRIKHGFAMDIVSVHSKSQLEHRRFEQIVQSVIKLHGSYATPLSHLLAREILCIPICRNWQLGEHLQCKTVPREC